MAIELEEIEVMLLVEAVYQRWGFDFRDYSMASLRRRIERIVVSEKLPSISALQGQLLRDSAAMQRFIEKLVVSVTSMFRDPGFYLAFRALAVPVLRKPSPLRVWHAGCASGEEVYSMAILLQEESMLDGARIYATDLNAVALERARGGVYELNLMKEFSENYQAAGGKGTFSDYYHVDHGRAIFRENLSKRVVWAQHNLVTDASFQQFDLILCRNVLIYFNGKLRDRVHDLLYESLRVGGLLVLGRQESLAQTSHASSYRTLESREKIFERVK